MTQYKIIIVENDEDEQFFMNESFRKSDLFDVTAVVNNGNALMEWLHQHSNELPDLILSDLNMPGKNGYDIITEIKESPEWAHIPVIITSTSSTKTFIERCLALGAADYLVKPETFIDYGPYIEQLYQVVENKIAIK
jgi:CheY-like chemotaxis protein